MYFQEKKIRDSSPIRHAYFSGGPSRGGLRYACNIAPKLFQNRTAGEARPVVPAHLGQRYDSLGLVERQALLGIRQEEPHVGLHVGLQGLGLVGREGHIRAAHARAHDAGVQERVRRVVLPKDTKIQDVSTRMLRMRIRQDKQQQQRTCLKTVPPETICLYDKETS